MNRLCVALTIAATFAIGACSSSRAPSEADVKKHFSEDPDISEVDVLSIASAPGQCMPLSQQKGYQVQASVVLIDRYSKQKKLPYKQWFCFFLDEGRWMATPGVR